LGDLSRDLSAKQRFAAALAGDRGDDDNERVLWEGKYSPRAMVGTWITAGVGTLGVLVAGLAMGWSGRTWLWAMLAIVAAWVLLGVWLLYRQLSVRYFLTSQRLLHERGLLWREIDRIEAIDIDDVVFHQGPVERLLGVGTVRIRSSDLTTPEFEVVGIDDVRNVAAMLDEVRRQERRKRGVHIESV
jgi:membrane protein YdbS with pleckstrin-like domain